MSEPPEDYCTGLSTSRCRRQELTEEKKERNRNKDLEILRKWKVKNNDREDNY